MKKCSVKIKKLKKQDEKLYTNVNYEECDKVAVPVKSENQSTYRHSILKPFNIVPRLGDISFTSDGPLIKLSEKENVPKPTERITRSYRRKISNDIYEFSSQSEKDCDPMADVVKKMIKERRAQLVKRKPQNQTCNSKERKKSISEYVSSVERYCRRSYEKVLREMKSNCQATLNQKSEDSKYERNLNLDEFHESRSSDVVNLNDNMQKPTEEVDPSQNRKIEKIRILEVLILPNKAVIKPTATIEDKTPEAAINSNAAMDYEEICDTADIPGERESDSEIFLNWGDYLLNEKIDYCDLSKTSEPSPSQIDSCSVGGNSTAKTADPELKNTSICHKPSTQMDSISTEQAELEIDEQKPSFAQTDFSVEAKIIVKTPEPKPIRKAFWEIEDLEGTLDKSLIKKTYSRQKPKEPRSRFFILFSDDEDSKKSDKGTKGNCSGYYTRTKIQNWMESTKSETVRENNLDVKQTDKIKKAILRTQNKISDNRCSLKNQQKQNTAKNKINNKIKEEKCISSSNKTRGRSFRQLRRLRL